MIKYLNIPYLNRGRTREGLDCYGLAIMYYKEKINISLPDFFYINSSNKDEIKLKLPTYAKNFIKHDSPKKDRLIVFSIYGLPVHIGIMINDFEFIHILKNTRVTIESINSIIWRNKIEGYYSYDS